MASSKNGQLGRRNEVLKNKARQALWFSENGPCSHCNSWEDLEVDHVDPSKKLATIAWSHSDEWLTKELDKCQVLCHNCHRVKTNAEITKPIPHGTYSGYSWYRCRCDNCKKARLYYDKVRLATI